jgi:serine/threonine protein kinase
MARTRPVPAGARCTDDIRADLIGFSYVTAVTEDIDALIGKEVGNYRIASKIGAGGMGAVFLARHMLLGKRAAVKVLLPERCTNPEIVDRFFNEARAASSIRHPGIIDIFDYGRMPDGNAYIVMECLEGETLGERLKRVGVVSAQEAASVSRHVAGALAAAHGHGIIHRDLKPDNIFLVPDPAMPRGERAKLLDFGIAKLQTTAGDLVKTDTGRLMGTPYYMSPEQCRGAGKVDHRTDVYSLGCVMYQMLTERPPFVLEGAGEILAAHIYEQPKSLRLLNPNVPIVLDQLVLQLLEKDPNKRYQSMDEVVIALNEAVMKFAGPEETEPSLAESNKFPTARTPKLAFSDSATTVNSQTGAYDEIMVEKRPGRRGWVIAALAVLAVAAAVGFVMQQQDGDASAVAGSADAAPTVAVAPSEAPPEPPQPVVHELAPAEVLSGADGHSSGSRLLDSDAYVTMMISSEPDGAMVYREVDGVKVGATPVAVQVIRGNGEASFYIKKSGYHTERLALLASEDQDTTVVLRARRGESIAPPSVKQGGDGASKDASKDGASKDGASKDGASKDGASKDGESKDGASEDGASKDGASEDGAPGGEAKTGAAGDGSKKKPRGEDDPLDPFQSLLHGRGKK